MAGEKAVPNLSASPQKRGRKPSAIPKVKLKRLNVQDELHRLKWACSDLAASLKSRKTAENTLQARVSELENAFHDFGAMLSRQAVRTQELDASLRDLFGRVNASKVTIDKPAHEGHDPLGMLTLAEQLGLYHVLDNGNMEGDWDHFRESENAAVTDIYRRLAKLTGRPFSEDG